MPVQDPPSKPVIHRWNVTAADTALIADGIGQELLDKLKKVGERNGPFVTDGCANVRISFVGEHETLGADASDETVGITIYGYDGTVDGDKAPDPIRLAKGTVTFGSAKRSDSHPYRPNEVMTGHVYYKSGRIVLTATSGDEIMTPYQIHDSKASNDGWARLQIDPQTCPILVVVFDTFSANLGRVDCECVKQG